MRTETGAYGTATYSDDGLHRYRLTVPLPQPLADPEDGVRDVVFVMLNPSTATHDGPDKTLRRCAGYTRRFGGARMHVVNAYALRATDPSVLRQAGTSAIGTDNDATIRGLLIEVRSFRSLWIAAWGVHVNDGAPGREAELLSMFDATWTPLHRLGPPTRGGHPRHPLYLQRTVELERVQ